MFQIEAEFMLTKTRGTLDLIGLIKSRLMEGGSTLMLAVWRGSTNSSTSGNFRA